MRDEETQAGRGRPRLGRGDVYPGTVVDGPPAPRHHMAPAGGIVVGAAHEPRRARRGRGGRRAGGRAASHPRQRRRGRLAQSLTLVVNQVTGGEAGALTSILDGLRAAGARDQVVLPRDEQLRGMLDSATFNFDALARPTRMAVRALGLAVARKFV